MAQVPTQAKVTATQKSTAKQIELKEAAQKAIGKQFVADTRVGVVPEKVWKAGKNG